MKRARSSGAMATTLMVNRADRMQRHPGLQRLSREHHQALVLARLLETAGTGAADSRDDLAAVITRVRADWAAHVAPHFAIEERELFPLCHGAGSDLGAATETVRQDHAALRSMLAGLTESSSSSDVLALANRLQAHVRFEERVWFPALEAALDQDTLAALEWRLDAEPRVPIVGFRPDEAEAAGSWIAILACGHGQHIRHRPPFREAEWVTTAEGRAAKIGTRLACVLCRMPRLPPAAVCYKETSAFDEHGVPAGLLASHTLRAGIWGQIVVLEGKVDYIIEDVPALSFVLRPGVEGAVAPERPHHVRPQPGARFKVRFLR
jgi:tellurite methyltransferase